MDRGLLRFLNQPISRHLSAGAATFTMSRHERAGDVMGQAPRPEDEAALREAASLAMSRGQRVFGDGGVVEQIAEAGSRAQFWSCDKPPDQDHVRWLTATLKELGDRVVEFRAELPSSPDVAEVSYAGTLDRLLPMNRKERYFTGTVLPAIVAERNFAHLHLLTDLCGLDVEPLQAHQVCELQFWTEYGFAESRFSEADRLRFPDAPSGRDTPDVVIVGADWLLAIEAKLFDWPAAASLRRQLQIQSELVEYWTRTLGIDSDRVAHVALLPATYAEQLAALDHQIVTWEQLETEFTPLVQTYWTRVLRTALQRYDDLVSKNRGLDFGKNADAHCTGKEVVTRFGEGTLEFEYMGRAQGLGGRPLSEDIASGSWRERMYEVRREPIDAPNWFPIAEFLARIPSS